MSRGYHRVTVQEWKPPRRRRTNKPRAEAEILQRNFWLHFDLEKFARDWRRGVGLRAGER